MHNPPYVKPDMALSWIFEVLGPLVWLGLGAYCVTRSWRDRRLTVTMLLFISATSMFWQEFYGDWGAFLLYNPDFHLMGWKSSTWTTPNKPWAVLPAYGWYYTIVYPLMLRWIHTLRERVAWGRLTTLIAVAFPVFYLWDLFVEGFAAGLGWWSYTTVYGAAILTDRGNFPLLYPLLLFVFYGVVTTWVLDQRDDSGRHRHETLLRVHRVRAGWRREVARVASWVAMMNAVYLVTLILPLVAVRELFLVDSRIVP